MDDDDLSKVDFCNWGRATSRQTMYAIASCAFGNHTYGKLKMHRVIMGAQPGQVIDHINHNGLDNRRSNLRVVTPQQNSQHSRKRRGEFTSSFKGVSFHKESGTWRAHIRSDGKHVYLGGFSNDRHAAVVYDAAAVLVFGEFAVLNKPRCSFLDAVAIAKKRLGL